MKTLAPCPECGSTGPWKDGRGRATHIRSHHEATCPECEITVNSVGLAAHRRYVHGVEGATSAARAARESPEPSDIPGELIPGDVTPPPPPPVELRCPDCDAGPWASVQRLESHRVRHRTVVCPDCDETVKASGIGNHRAAHRRAAEARQEATTATKVTAIDRRLARGLAAALGDLLPGGAPDLIDRLATFVAKHEPDPGRGRWVAVTATAGPWLCRTAGVGLVVDREHVPVVVVSLDDVYAHLRRERAAS